MARAGNDGAVENPLAAEGGGSGGLAASGGAAAGSSSVDIEAGLKDSTLTAEQAVALAASKLTRPTTRLANDVLLLIATRGTAKDLGKAQVVSRGWQAAARREVTLRTTGRVLNVFSEKPAYLRSIELLDAVVGPKPAGSWRDRWPELQYAKFLRVDESWAGLQHRETVIQFFRDNLCLNHRREGTRHTG